MPKKFSKVGMAIASEYTFNDFRTLLSDKSLRNKDNAKSLNLTIGGAKYAASIKGSRLECLLRNQTCVSCGLVGSVVRLESHKNDAISNNGYHFNIYARVTDQNYAIGYRLVLMTQDHKFPQAYGGTSTQENLQTMCSDCNRIKGDEIDFSAIPEYSENSRRSMSNKFLYDKTAMTKTLLWLMLSPESPVDKAAVRALGKVNFAGMATPEILIRTLSLQLKPIQKKRTLWDRILGN